MKRWLAVLFGVLLLASVGHSRTSEIPSVESVQTVCNHIATTVMAAGDGFCPMMRQYIVGAGGGGLFDTPTANPWNNCQVPLNQQYRFHSMRTVAKATATKLDHYWTMKVAYADASTTAYNDGPNFLQDTTGAADALIYTGNDGVDGENVDIEQGECSAEGPCSVRFDPSKAVAGWWRVQIQDVGVGASEFQTVQFCIDFTVEDTGNP